MMRPRADEYAAFYSTYVTLVPEDDVLAVLRAQVGVMRTLAANVPVVKETHAYDPGKWTVRQVIGHVTDAERVFSYRALCFSRSDATPTCRQAQPQVAGRQVAVVEQVQEIGLLGNAGTRGVMESVWPRTQGDTFVERIVATITPEDIASDSTYRPAPVATSGGRPSLPPFSVAIADPNWIRSAIAVRRPSEMRMASESCARPV